MRNIYGLSSPSWLMRRLGILALLAAIAGPARAQAPLPVAPASARTNVPEASGYGILYQLDVPTAASFNTTGITYTTNNSAQALANPARVAYYLELTNSATNATTYVWTSMANFATTLTQLGIPNPSSNNVSWHQNVSSLNVFSNVTGVTTGTNLGTGRIEMWPMNYMPNNVDGVPGASNTTFDFGDQMSSTGNYGSFQVHNVSAGQTVLAYNNWGGNGGNSDIGIGSQPQAGNSNPDWTFAFNAGTYSVKRITILATTPPTLTSLSPTGGPVGTSVTLTGTNLAGTSAVSFNGTAATSFTVVSATTVTAIVPTGTTTGLVTVTTPGGVSNGLTFVAGPPTNNALAFNGTNNSVPITRPIQDDFTIEYWVKTSQVSLTGSQWYLGNGIVDGEVSGVTNDFGTALLNGKASFGTGSPDVTIVSTTTINDGKWHHVAATRTKSTGLMLLYVDGKLEASSAGTTTSTISLTAPPRLLLGGTQTGASFFAGQLDEVRLYTTALTQTQVQADMFSTTSAASASQVTYYNFDQGSAGNTNTGITSLPDLSGSSNTGTLQNFALTGITSNWVRSFPTITGISPTSGPAGTSVAVTGTNLMDATSIKFNTTAVAPFATPTSDLTATVVVPSGATTGAVSVASTTLTTYNGPVFTVMTCPLPTAITQSTTVALAANGAGTLAATTVNNGSTPTNCGNLTYQVQKVVYGLVRETGTLTLTAPTGAVFTAVTFASYGTPTGSNGNYALGACNATNSQSIVAGYLVGKNSATIPANNGLFGDPCYGTVKYLAVQAVYTALAPQVSYGCADVAGPNYVLLTVTDAANNTSTTTASVSVTAPPAATITSLSPSSGAAGQTITVNGTNLGAATGLSVNGTSATINNNTGSSFTFVVPSGASALGNVVVSASCVPASAAFTVVGGDLIVSTTMTIPAGTYNNVTVTSTGNGTLGGDVVVNTTIVVQDGGTLSDGCNLITGSGTFTLAAGGTLVICRPRGILAVGDPQGNIGTVRVTGGRSFSTDASYVYVGSDVTGSGLPGQVRNLSIASTNDVGLTQSTAVAQVLTLSNTGNLVLNGQTMTLLSSAAGTALAVNSGSGSVSGATATVQRYLDPSVNAGLGYRHYSTPVSGATVASLSTTGFTPEISQANTYNTSLTPGTTTPFPTVFAYDQSRVVTQVNNLSAFDKGFVVPTSLSASLNVGQGYAVQIGATPRVNFTGVLMTGTQSVILPRYSATSIGWQLVGNPYPAPLDFSQLAPGDRTGLDAAMYVFESSGPYTGTYRSYVNGVGTSSFIGSSQGFFVRVSDGQNSGTLTFRNAQRVTSYSVAVPMRRGAADTRPLVQLDLRGATGPADTFYAYAQAGATPAFDAQLDALKRANSTGLNLASLADGAADGLAIDARPAFTAATVLPLTLGVPAAGTYTLTAAALNNLPAGLNAYLRDAATGQSLNLSQQSRYTFAVSAAQATAGLSTRFSLSFSPQAALATTAALSPDEVTLFPNPAHASFTVLVPAVAGTAQLRAELLNTLGQVVRRHAAALPADGARLTVDTAGLAVGVYTLRLYAGPTTLTKRVVLQ